MRDTYDTNGPGRYEGEPPMARFLDERCEPDEYVGSEFDMRLIERYGRRTLSIDSVGFVHYDRHETERDAIEFVASIAEDLVGSDDWA